VLVGGNRWQLMAIELWTLREIPPQILFLLFSEWSQTHVAVSELSLDC
jgi:hypothetical protein